LLPRARVDGGGRRRAQYRARCADRGDEGTVSNAVLSALAAAATIKVLIDLRSWTC
jgi:hypothetical protein